MRGVDDALDHGRLTALDLETHGAIRGYIVEGNVQARAACHDAVRQPKTIKGVLAYDQWVIPRALEWVVRARNRYPFDELVGARFPLDRINEAFEQAEWAAGKGGVARTVIVP